MTIPKRIKKLADRSGRGFDDLFNKEVNNHYTKEEAFWALENEYREYVRENDLSGFLEETRYKNYESYRQSRRQRIERKKSNLNVN